MYRRALIVRDNHKAAVNGTDKGGAFNTGITATGFYAIRIR